MLSSLARVQVIICLYLWDSDHVSNIVLFSVTLGTGIEVWKLSMMLSLRYKDREHRSNTARLTDQFDGVAMVMQVCICTITDSEVVPILL